jgi:1-acylglycerone phosphate reductase
VTSKESISAAVEHVSRETSGRLNALYNNAGAAADNIPTLEVDLEAARRLFEVDYWGVLAVTQAFAPLLIETANDPSASKEDRQANLVMTGSITSVRPFPFRAVYGACKAAVEALCDSLRSELSGLGLAPFPQESRLN